MAFTIMKNIKSNSHHHLADLAFVLAVVGAVQLLRAHSSLILRKNTLGAFRILRGQSLQGANKGATGRPVSLLTQFLINQTK